MYLDLKTIEQIIKNGGIEFHEKVFLSSEIKKSKHVGDLYDYITLDLDVDPEKIVHIGDNYDIDIRRARKHGLAAMHLQADRSAFDGRRLWSESTLFRNSGFTKNFTNTLYIDKFCAHGPDFTKQISENQDTYRIALGWLVLAPLLIDLCVWIKSICDKNRIDKVLFLSRDGYVVKRAFDKLYGNANIETNYSYASRRMLTIPFLVLSQSEIENYFWKTIQSARVVDDILTRMPGSNLLRERLLDFGFSGDTIITRKNRRHILRVIGENSGLINLEFSEEREIVSKYFTSMLSASDKVAIFDLGWRGTLQLAISRAVPSLARNTRGLYFGTTHEAVDRLLNTGLQYSSFGMSNGRPEVYRRAFQTHTDVVEFLFSANHAGIETVEECEEGFRPNFQPTSDAEIATQEIAADIQSGAMSAVEFALCQADVTTIETISDRETGIRDFISFLDQPNKIDVRHLSDVRIFSAIGDVEGVPLIDIGADRSVFRRHLETKWPSALHQKLSPLQRLLILIARPERWLPLWQRLSGRK
ncbi:hypothetical protein FGB62_678g01 [Gracilaria domingensis]|nr:hypothetical protein FGB62_678g01 [Gracilaria domingensis]